MARFEGFVPPAKNRPGFVQAARADKIDSISYLFEEEMENLYMVSKNKSKIIVLAPYMEVIGPFVEIDEEDGVLLAEIGKYIVVLPFELKEVLSPHLGRKITILRTDIPGKEYLFRVIPEREPEPKQETGKMFANGLCEVERTPSCCEVEGA
jgi:hypothetical protein